MDEIRRNDRGPRRRRSAVAALGFALAVLLATQVSTASALERTPVGAMPSGRGALTIPSGTYRVVFAERGLPTGTTWTVTFGAKVRSGNGSTIGFSAGNGSHAYRIGVLLGEVPTPENGTVTVAGASVRVPISFGAVAVRSGTFRESGLPTGTNWSVTLGGVTTSGTSANLSVAANPGTYPFALGPVPGYLGSPPNGTVNLTSGNATVSVVFVAEVWGVTFAEQGLPMGERWSVEFDGSSASTDLSTLAFSAVDGGYNFTVPAIDGYNRSPAAGRVVVDGSNQTVAVNFSVADYAVAFEAVGLPPGTAWNVTLNGSAESATGRSIAFELPDGAYPYDVGPPTGYAASPPGGVLDVAGENVTVNLTFSAILQTVTFHAIGLPPDAAWSVAIDNRTATAVAGNASVSLPDGAYGFVVVAPLGYTASPSAGNLTVAGESVQVTIEFQAPPPPSYAILFDESGLPVGTEWAVVLNGSPQTTTAGQVTFSRSNGTYPYEIGTPVGYRPTVPNGTVTVVGAVVVVNVTFYGAVGGQYEVAFVEDGLPDGTNWSVYFGAYYLADRGPILEFPATNGTYAYRVGAVPGYQPSTAAGEVVVVGGDLRVDVNFSAAGPSLYAVLFSETGLPNGTNWAVTIAPSTANSTSATIEFLEANGSVAFQIGEIDGYTPTPGHGTVDVNGTELTVPIRFSAPPATGGLSIAGLSPGVGLGVLVGVVALGAAAVLVARRRLQRSQGPVPRRGGPPDGGDGAARI